MKGFGFGFCWLGAGAAGDPSWEGFTGVLG